MAQNTKNNQIEKVPKSEGGKVFAAFAVVWGQIEFERNQAGEGCNQSAQTAYIYAEKKRRIIFGKAGQKKGGRHIADKLAAKKSHAEFISRQNAGQETADFRNELNVVNKNEKAEDLYQIINSIFQT